MRYSSNLIRHVFYKIISNNNIIFIYLFNLLQNHFLQVNPNPPGCYHQILHSELKQRKVYIPDFINSNQKFDVSLDRTLLTNITKSECLCFNSHCTNLSSQSTEREKISTWDCRFWCSGCQSFCYLMHQSIPAGTGPPPPPPTTGLLRGHCLPCQSWGWGICKFCSAWGLGTFQPPGNSQAFNTHAVYYQNISTRRILLAKQAYWVQLEFLTDAQGPQCWPFGRRQFY